MKSEARIYVAGGKGLVGSAICRRLSSRGYRNVVSSDIDDFDLTDPSATVRFFNKDL